MRRTPLAVSAAVFSTLLALPAAAETFAQPNPMSKKYRDTGAKPVGGRSGSAALEVRALRDRAGATELEVTTGQFEGAAPKGTLAKVQVKLLTASGESMQTDNYKKTLTGNGYASFTYDELRRGQKVQVQANVTGIDPNRTDVVTVATDVHLRPDIEALSINAPGQVLVNAPVVVTGSMGEVNGDVGARATCRLLVDGVEVGAIAHAWVDAASNVICQFNTSFATAGAKALTFRVTDVNPGDYDSGNNDVGTTVSVIEPAVGQPYRYMYAWAQDGAWQQRYREERQFQRTGGGVSTWVREFDGHNRYQSFGAYAEFSEGASLSSGRVKLAHASDGTALPLLDIAVADLPYSWSDGLGHGCRYGYLTAGAHVEVCSYDGFSRVYTQRWAQHVVYFIDRATASGEPWWCCSYDNSGTVYDVPGIVPIGATYTAELTHEDEAGIHHGTLDVALPLYQNAYDNWSNPSCWINSWSEGTESYCQRQQYFESYRYGSSSIFNP
jgi:hypothetical protein